MTPLAWLALAVAASVAAYALGWPALRSQRSREARDLNAERYLAWRGRARPTSAGSASRPRMTPDERRRLTVAGLALLLAVAALVAFLLAGS